MKVLVIGSGGREHTLVWKIADSARVEKVYCAPGNAGIQALAECIDVKVGGDFSEVKQWVRDNNIDLTFVGPEVPLVEGIVDAFEADGLAVFGPCKAASQLEGSKVFSKEFMLEAGIPTGAAECFTETAPALRYLKTQSPPFVIKAQGLAAGKGVVIAATEEEAEAAIRENLDDAVFGEASNSILIEEFMVGEEASVLAFTDGKSIAVMPSAQDHKAVFEGDKGPNTGGMGAYSPAPVVTPVLEKEIYDTVLAPAVKAMRERGTPYKGVLYAGLMIGRRGDVRVVEFNCRFGDPEAQPLLMRLETDLIDVAEAVIEGRLTNLDVKWRPDPTVCVVLASAGYPGPYEKGIPISGLDAAGQREGVVVFHAGTAMKDGQTTTNGGRVLGVTAAAPTLEEAIHRCYAACDDIEFEGAYMRRDIAKKALDRK